MRSPAPTSATNSPSPWNPLNTSRETVQKGFHLVALAAIASATYHFSTQGWARALALGSVALTTLSFSRIISILGSLKDEEVDKNARKINQAVNGFLYTALAAGAVTLGLGAYSLLKGSLPFYTAPYKTWTLLPSLKGVQNISMSFAYIFPFGAALVSYAFKTLQHHEALTATMQQWSQTGVKDLARRSLEWASEQGYDLTGTTVSWALSWAKNALNKNQIQNQTVNIDDLQYYTDGEIANFLIQHHGELNDGALKGIIDRYLNRLPLEMFFYKDRYGPPLSLKRVFDVVLADKSDEELRAVFDANLHQLGVFLNYPEQNRIRIRVEAFLNAKYDNRPQLTVTGQMLGIPPQTSALERVLASHLNPADMEPAAVQPSAAAIQILARNQEAIQAQLLICAQGNNFRQLVAALSRSLPEDRLKPFQDAEKEFSSRAKEIQRRLFDLKVELAPPPANQPVDIVSFLIERGLNEQMCAQIIATCHLLSFGDPLETIRVNLNILGIDTAGSLYDQQIMDTRSIDPEVVERMNTPEKIQQRLIAFFKKPAAVVQALQHGYQIEPRGALKKTAMVAHTVFQYALTFAGTALYLNGQSNFYKAICILPRLVNISEVRFGLRNTYNHLPSIAEISQSVYFQALSTALWLFLTAHPSASDTPAPTLFGRVKQWWSWAIS